MGFITRWICAFALLSATYNPTEYNYLRWSQDYGAQNRSLMVLLGLFLLVFYIIYLRATFRSIGAFGVLLVLAIVGALVWVLADFGVLSLDDPGLNTWIGIGALSVVMGVGISWSIVRRTLTGQADMDDLDE